MARLLAHNPPASFLQPPRFRSHIALESFANRYNREAEIVSDHAEVSAIPAVNNLNNKIFGPPRCPPAAAKGRRRSQEHAPQLQAWPHLRRSAAAADHGLEIHPGELRVDS